VLEFEVDIYIGYESGYGSSKGLAGARFWLAQYPAGLLYMYMEWVYYRGF
jgi:hypothetical protein